MLCPFTDCIDVCKLLSISTSLFLSSNPSKMPALQHESKASFCLHGYSQFL